MVKGGGPGKDAAAAGDCDPHRHLSTLPGWREFTALSPGQPELLAAAEYAALGDDARAAYDEERLDYHTRLGVVGTSVLRQAVTTGLRLTLLNRHAVSARCGLILSGAAGTGKTTAITQLGKTHEATDRARHPGRERIPVIYVTVPPAATPRMLAMEFARFLGLPIPARANMTDIIEAVCGVAVDTSVSMVLVDEIHNMQLATRSGAEVSDTLKYLSERIPATFVYAGIDLERQGLFAGIREAEIACRFTLIPTLPFPLADEWRGLVATLEDALRLRCHQAGTLAGLDRYLHQRTTGMIGSLSHLIRARPSRRSSPAPSRSPGSSWTPSASTTPPSGDQLPGRPPPSAPRVAGDRRGSAAAAGTAADPAPAGQRRNDLLLYPPSRRREPHAPAAPAPLPGRSRPRRRLPARLACGPGRKTGHSPAARARRSGTSRRHRFPPPA